MRLFRKLFGPRRQPIDRPAPTKTIEDLKALGRPCLRLLAGGEGRSRLGGIPDLIGAWPRFEGRPLSCVAQLEVSEIRAVGAPHWLPAEGRLLFFYDAEDLTRPHSAKDAGRFAVIHQIGAATPATEPDDLPENWRLPARPVTFVRDVSMPSQERIAAKWGSFDLELGRTLEDALEEMEAPSPVHQMAGYPAPIQWDHMELDCQKIMHPQWTIADAASWRLLLQLDSDDDSGMLWDDEGRLYFWIHEKDALAGDFSKAWVILQSH